MEELQQPLLAGLAAALPKVGNGLAAVVSYGEAHLYMQQLQAAADAARSKAAAAAAALAAASEGEVAALTAGAAAGQKVTVLLTDYRRLCSMASSSMGSAASWLSRHQETLRTLLQQQLQLAGGVVGSASTGQVQGLLAPAQEWDVAACDRSLLLLCPNVEDAAAAGSPQHASGVQDGGILARSLAGVLGSSSSSIAQLLPQQMLQQCQQADNQGQLLLQQQSRLMHLGRWAVAAYAAVLQHLLPGENRRRLQPYAIACVCAPMRPCIHVHSYAKVDCRLHAWAAACMYL
jgi:hypothetical protein